MTDRQYSFFMPEELYDLLAAKAAEEDRTVAATVREAIRRYVTTKAAKQ